MHSFIKTQSLQSTADIVSTNLFFSIAKKEKDMKEQTEKNKSTSQFLKTDGGKTKSNSIEVPSISLPKGGCKIKGIDEKFSVNDVNGTISFSTPRPFSPARSSSPYYHFHINQEQETAFSIKSLKEQFSSITFYQQIKNV